jgi:hypothetical protein
MRLLPQISPNMFYKSSVRSTDINVMNIHYGDNPVVNLHAWGDALYLG